MKYKFLQIYINASENLIKSIWMIFHFLITQKVAAPIISIKKSQYLDSIKKLTLQNDMQNYSIIFERIYKKSSSTMN